MLFLFALLICCDAAFLLLLLWQGWTDARSMRLPDRGNLAIAFLALLRLALRALLSSEAAGAAPETALPVLMDPAASFLSGASMGECLAGALAVSLPMYLFEMLRPGSFGGGDIKFCAAAGLYLGARNLLTGCFLGLLLAGGYALLLVAKAFINKRKIGDQLFPLGPFLSIGFLYAAIAIK